MESFLEIIRGIFPARKISVRGPLESVDGKMLLQIPLDAGGRDLAYFAGRIGRIEDGHLKIEILPWLAEKLGVRPGSIVVVDNLEGEFRITPAEDEKSINQSAKTTDWK